MSRSVVDAPRRLGADVQGFIRCRWSRRHARPQGRALVRPPGTGPRRADGHRLEETGMARGPSVAIRRSSSIADQPVRHRASG
jgi:hypothetical protein